MEHSETGGGIQRKKHPFYRVKVAFDHSKLTLKCLGKNVGVDSAGNMITDIHVHSWIAIPVYDWGDEKFPRRYSIIQPIYVPKPYRASRCRVSGVSA